jgi:hypothetical protein
MPDLSPTGNNPVFRVKAEVENKLRQSVLCEIDSMVSDPEIVPDGRNIFFPRRHSMFRPKVNDKQFKLEMMDDEGTPRYSKRFACTED